MSAVVHRIDGSARQCAAELERVRNHVRAVLAEPAVLFRQINFDGFFSVRTEKLTETIRQIRLFRLGFLY